MPGKKGVPFWPGGKREGSGRKKLAATLLKAKFEDRIQDAQDAFNFNVAIMNDPNESKSLRQAASVEIMNRVVGKPKQAVEHAGANGGNIMFQIVKYEWSCKKDSNPL